VCYILCDLYRQSLLPLQLCTLTENMKLGIDAVGQGGGIVEAAVCYTGDVSDPKRGLYDLEYYLNFVRELEAQGIHVLAIKGEYEVPF